MRNWTKDKPSRTGFYWFRELTSPGGLPPTATIVEVVITDQSFVVKLGEDGDKDLENLVGEWIGPIEIPK